MGGDLRPPQRAPLLALGFIGLLLGVTAGLARLGYRMPEVSAAASAWHGPLMIGGFFGVVIALERAVAIGHYVAYLGPLFGGLGSLAIAIGEPAAGAWLLVVGSVVLLGASIDVLRRQQWDDRSLGSLRPQGGHCDGRAPLAGRSNRGGDARSGRRVGLCG